MTPAERIQQDWVQKYPTQLLPWAAGVNFNMGSLAERRQDNKILKVCTAVMHQSIKTTAPRPTGLSGECKISEIWISRHVLLFLVTKWFWAKFVQTTCFWTISIEKFGIYSVTNGEKQLKIQKTCINVKQLVSWKVKSRENVLVCGLFIFKRHCIYSS